jgi:hypothetical protein
MYPGENIASLPHTQDELSTQQMHGDLETSKRLWQNVDDRGVPEVAWRYAPDISRRTR